MNFTQQRIPASTGTSAGASRPAATPTMVTGTMTITTPGARLA